MNGPNDDDDDDDDSEETQSSTSPSPPHESSNQSLVDRVFASLKRSQMYRQSLDVVRQQILSEMVMPCFSPGVDPMEKERILQETTEAVLWSAMMNAPPSSTMTSAAEINDNHRDRIDNSKVAIVAAKLRQEGCLLTDLEHEIQRLLAMDESENEQMNDHREGEEEKQGNKNRIINVSLEWQLDVNRRLQLLTLLHKAEWHPEVRVSLDLPYLVTVESQQIRMARLEQLLAKHEELSLHLHYRRTGADSIAQLYYHEGLPEVRDSFRQVTDAQHVFGFLQRHISSSCPTKGVDGVNSITAEFSSELFQMAQQILQKILLYRQSANVMSTTSNTNTMGSKNANMKPNNSPVTPLQPNKFNGSSSSHTRYEDGCLLLSSWDTEIEDDAYLDALRHYAIGGLPAALRGAFYRHLLGIPSSLGRKGQVMGKGVFNAQQKAGSNSSTDEQLHRYILLTHYATVLEAPVLSDAVDLDITTVTNDERFFVFEDTIRNVLKCFAWTPMLPEGSSSPDQHLSNHQKPSPLTSLQAFKITPFASSYLLAPLCFVFDTCDEAQLLQVLETFWHKYWRHLMNFVPMSKHEVTEQFLPSKRQEYLLPLHTVLSAFESILEHVCPDALQHCNSFVDAKLLLLPSILTAFSSCPLDPDQLLILWDLLLGLDTLNILGIFAAAVFYEKRAIILDCQSGDEIKSRCFLSWRKMSVIGLLEALSDVVLTSRWANSSSPT